MTEMSCGQIEVVQIPVGMLRSNCYLAYCSNTRKALIIDPGEDGDTILRIIEKLNLQPVWILLTHGHGDHIGAVGIMKDRFQIPVAIHRDESHFLTDARANLSSLFGEPILAPHADRLLKDGEQLAFEDRIITILPTPGHSPGGISILLDHHVFTGDALFKETVGRTDLPGCSHFRLIQGIREHILTLEDNTIIYPGHGPITTVGEERLHNPYLQGIQ